MIPKVSRPALLLLLGLIISVPTYASAPPAALIASGRLDDVISQMSSRVQSNPQDAEAYNLLARAYYAIQRWDEAISNGERAVALQPNNSVYHMWLGRIYGGKADNVSFLSAMDFAKKVRNEFERAVQLDGSNIAARADLAEFYVSAPGFLGGGKDKAREQASQIAQKDPALAHWVLAIVAEKDKNYEMAEQELKAALQASGSQAKYWMNLASFYRRRARSNDMESAVRQAVAVAGAQKQVLYDAANTLFRGGRNFAAAVEYLRSYIAGGQYSEDAPLVQAHFLLGSILEKSGDKASAANEYRAALSLAKDFKRAQSALQRL